MVNEHAVVLADDQITGIAEQTRRKNHRGKGPDSTQCCAPNPTQGLATVIPCQDNIAHDERFDIALHASGKGYRGAARKRNAQQIAQLIMFWIQLYFDKIILFSRRNG